MMNRKQQSLIYGEIVTSVGAKANERTEEGSSPMSRTLSLSKSSQKDNVNNDKGG